MKRFSETTFRSVREHQLSAHTPATGAAGPWELPPGQVARAEGRAVETRAEPGTCKGSICRFLSANNKRFIKKKKKKLRKCANNSHFCSKEEWHSGKAWEKICTAKKKRSCTIFRLNSELPEQEGNGIYQWIISDYFGCVFDSLAFLPYIKVSFLLFSEIPKNWLKVVIYLHWFQGTSSVLNKTFRSKLFHCSLY